MGKLILFFIFTFSAFAFSPENYFLSDILTIETALAKTNSATNEKKFETNFDLRDFENKGGVSKDFKVSKYFRSNVEFWFKVYTNYDSNQVALHDKKNLSLIYDVIDYTELRNSDLNKFTKYSLQNKLTAQYIKKFTKQLNLMGRGRKGDKNLYSKILLSLKSVGIDIPKNRSKRKKLFKKLKSNLRAQTGQRDHIKRGIKNFVVYEKILKEMIHEFGLPSELLAIPFLESSFNPKAKSKVGATGPWQFMTFIGKHFMYVGKKRDDRYNPILSSSSAFHLLAQNKKILKRWDLAITAYNSGTKHLLRAKRKFGNSTSLEKIIKKYKHPHLGFASKNFYTEFLALVYTLANHDTLFPDIKANDKDKIYIYSTLCSFVPLNLFSKLRGGKEELKQLNHHLRPRYWKSSFSRGTPLFSRIRLNKKRYKEISYKEMKKRYPRNWSKLIRNYKCSNK